MEPERMNNIKNWPEPKSIREIQVFIVFANFYKQFIENFSIIVRPLSLILKIEPGSRASKLIQNNTQTLFQPDSTLFLTPKAKKSFQRLKNTFWKEPVLQHFDVSKPIWLETNTSRKTMEGVLFQQDKEMNWPSIIDYSRKMLSAEWNHETHDAELWTIVDAFKILRHYLEGAAHMILVLTDDNNL